MDYPILYAIFEYMQEKKSLMSQHKYFGLAWKDNSLVDYVGLLMR